MSPVTQLLRCHLCNLPVFLEPSRVDDRGRPVHEDCYVRDLITERYPEEKFAA
jgi:hypothetical protein